MAAKELAFADEARHRMFKGGLFVTTEASITEAPKKESCSHATPPGMEM